MTPSQQPLYWRKYAKQNTRMERLAYRVMLRAISEGLKPVYLHLTQFGPEATIDNLDRLFPESVIRTAYNTLYQQVGVSQKVWADQDIKDRFPRKKEEDKLPKKPIFGQVPNPNLIRQEVNFQLGFFNPAWLARLKDIVESTDVAARVTSVTDTIRDRIKKSIGQAQQEFVSIRKITARLRQDVGGIFSRQRAETIARTEVTQIANVAAEQSALETGLKLKKGWARTMDTRTRDSHRGVSTKLIDNEDKFIVGGKRMKYPGDPAGGIKEIIRCRCVVFYVPADDTEGFE